MRLSDDDDERGVGAPVVYTIIGVSVFILLVLAAVLVSDSRRTPSPAKAKATPTPTPQVETEAYGEQSDADFETLYRENKLRSEDLDFWDMYSGRALSYTHLRAHETDADLVCSLVL